MTSGMNPWLRIWTQPRETIRNLLQTNLTYGIYWLAAVYSLQNFFYFSNYWSIGLSIPFYAILIAGIVLCPLLGVIWLYFSSWILYFTGRWLEGKAPRLQLRTAIAWSKIPTSLNLVMWFILLVSQSEYVFILDGGGPSSLFINFITASLGIWSLVLLVQCLREVQSFSVARSLVNIFLAWVVSSFLFFLGFAFLRYLYVLNY